MSCFLKFIICYMKSQMLSLMTDFTVMSLSIMTLLTTLLPDIMAFFVPLFTLTYLESWAKSFPLKIKKPLWDSIAGTPICLWSQFTKVQSENPKVSSPLWIAI